MELDEDIRVVVLTGSGKHFSVGGELKSFNDQEDQIDKYLLQVTNHFVTIQKVVIAVVNGTAAGAGMSLACWTDLTYATTNSKFTLAYTKAGLTPDGGSTYFLPRISLELKKHLN
ncbi:enoyl-CoA hydratase/isomerase family protein [Pseudalkalibacillus hwajinpoensis]|uniref:enoyl-CoA hydratase/isomerase family protein n=1 Tax=Guptibacillus hwajinpoensis TaxID=208199 RepID=UPI00325B44AF